MKLLLQFFFVLLLAHNAEGQIYSHDFGTTSINTHPYTVAPSIIDPNLSGSSWTNSTGAWSGNTGASGQALILFNSAGTTTITLLLNIAPGFEADITSFNFWRQRSNSGPQNWNLAINGIAAGSGPVPTTGATTGTTPVANPVTGLTGTITVTLTLTGAIGNGNIRIDNFTLNGIVASNCNSVDITGFSPATGPENTLVTITGSGFDSATSVKFDGIEAVYAALSDTEIAALVPAGAAGTIAVTAADGCAAYSAETFTILESACEGTASGDIYISELYDHTPGSYGMIELYNPTANTIVFNGQYVLERAGDVGGSPSYTLTLPGSIGPGMTFLVQSYGTGVTGCSVTPQASMGQGINADDEFKLRKNGSVIDIARAPSFIGYTVKRDPDATSPSPAYIGNDWSTSSNSCNGLGNHTTSPVVLPIPSITGPAVQSACENGTAVFSVSLPNPTNYTYQWKVLNNAGAWVNVVNNANYSGSATNTLILNQIPAGFNNNQYYCEITSALCNLVSNAAQLYVTPLPDTPVASVTQPDCTVSTGTITILSPTGAGLTYSIDGASYQPGTSFQNLAPDTYSITVKDVSGCVSETSLVVINEPADAPDVPGITLVQPTCTVPTGTITVTTPTGAGLTYSLDGTDFQTETTFTDLAPGTYTVTVQNADGCTSETEDIIINTVPNAPAVATTTVTQPTCTVPTGTITVTAPTGAGLTYSLDGTDFQTETTFTDFAPGTYTVTVQNANGCTSETGNIIIDAIPNAPAVATTTVTQPTCTVPTGAITVTAPTGAGLTYSIDSINYQSATSFNNLPAGNYTVTVKNQQGCTSTPSLQVINTVPTAPAAPTVSVTQPNCTVPTGSVTINAPVGNGLTYSVDGINYQPSAIFTSLSQGSYTITVKNAAGCISPVTVATVNSAPQVPAAPIVTVIQPDCITQTGTITVTTPTGAGLLYSIDGINYQTGTTFTNVSTGTYAVTVQAPGGCTSPSTAVAVNPVPAAPAVPVLSVTQPDCTSPTGIITVTSPTGTGLSYSIDNGISYQPAATFPGLGPGTYTITVQNAAGCTTASLPMAIDAAPAAAPNPGTITGNDLLCAGETSQLSNTVTGGIWSSSDNGIATTDSNGVVTALTEGTVTIRYTVGNECTAQSEFIITVNPVPAPALDSVYYICRDNETGLNSPVMLFSGYPVTGYTHAWFKDGAVIANTTNAVTVSEPGHYSVTVTDVATGCTGSASALVSVSSPAVATAQVQYDFNFNQAITVTVTGGSGVYEYSLNGGTFQDSPYFTGINEGEHTITVRDKNGCNDVELTVFAINYPRYFTPNGDGQHETWNITGLQSQPDALVYIFDRYGKLVSAIKPSGMGWDGTYNGERLPATDYWFTVLYKSSNGLDKEFKAHFSLKR